MMKPEFPRRDRREAFPAGIVTFAAWGCGFERNSAAVYYGSMLATRLKIETREIYACHFSQDGSRALTGSQPNQVSLWDLRNGERLRSYEHPNSVWALAWSPDGSQFLSADGSLRLWETESGKCLRVFEVPAARAIAWNIQENFCLCADRSSIQLFDLRAEKTIHTLSGHTDGVYALAFSPDRKRALSGSRDQTVRLWDLQTGACLRVFSGHTYHVHSVVWSRDGKTAVSCSRDHRIWEIETGECLAISKGHTDTIRSLQWNADQKRILSAAHDGAVRLWDIQTGSAQVFEGQGRGLVGAAFTDDERRICACDWNGVVQVWELPSAC